MKYKYAGKKNWWGNLTVKSGKTTVTINQAGLVNYSYRSLYGTTWDSLSNFDFNSAKVAGTTIVVRQEAKDNNVLAAPASAEVKVKIPAIAKAPKITIDYAKGQINIGNKLEYGIVEAAGIKKSGGAYTEGSGKVDISKFREDNNAGTDDFVVAARTKAISTKPANFF